MSEPPNKDEFGLVMPFVVCATNGGPYEDEAFVAGHYLGTLHEVLGTTRPPDVENYVPTPLVPQIDLLAMHFNYTMFAQPWDEYPDEWTYVKLVRLSDPKQEEAGC